MRKTSSMLNYLSVIFVFSFTLFVFRGYLVGETVPPWDFFGAYYTQAYSWWDLGSFFNPTTYLPYLISGYPSHLGLQFSSYYLPVGLVAEIARRAGIGRRVVLSDFFNSGSGGGRRGH
jgi:hypothetical protein